MRRSFVPSISFLVASLFITAILSTNTETVSADTIRTQEVGLIVADSQAIGSSSKSRDLVASFVGLITSLQQEQSFMFMDSDNSLAPIGPFAASDKNFETVRQEINSRLESSHLQLTTRLTETLTEAHLLLSLEDAAPGSPIYLISGNHNESIAENTNDHVMPLVTKFSDMGWHINTVTLPSSSIQNMNLLNTISESTGGQVFNLAISDGFRNVADQILKDNSKGSLGTLGQRQLKSSEIMSSILTVTPGTRATSLLFFRENSGGSLRLSDPSGYEIIASDRTASYVVETPNVVIWTLSDPEPGNWKVEARDMEGLISAWEYSANEYNLVLNHTGPVPLNEPTNIVAYVTDVNDRLVLLDDVRMFATITTPEGKTLVHEMMDDGLHSDNKGMDGYFSMLLPDIITAGNYQIELELSWIEYNNQISSITHFEAQAFPTIEIEPVEVQYLAPNERTKIATVYVRVSNRPYAIPTDQVTGSLASPDGQEGILEIEPKLLFGNGPAWEYDVFLTPSGEGHYTQVIGLTVEYAGRMHSQFTDSLVFTAKTPVIATTLQTVTKPIPVTKLSSPKQNVVLRESSTLNTESSGFNWIPFLIGVVSILLLIIVGIGISTIRRTLPKGYLYNDKGDFLVDFAQIRQTLVKRLIFRGSLLGSELNVKGLESLKFQFYRGGIKVRKLKNIQSVRINDEPLVDQAEIYDQTWIGTGGKLFNFVLTPLSKPQSAGGD